MSTSIARQSGQRERAYLRLRDMLLLQQIPEGIRLRETHWAERLSVNRMALREAFARLAGEGFLHRVPGKGYHVPLLTENDISEIRRTRLLLECGAIHELCTSGRQIDALLAPLRDACDDLRAFLQKGYQFGVIEADRRFHERLIDAAANSRLSALYRRAPLPLIREQADDNAPGERWAAVAARTLTDHQNIVTALATKNGAEAMRLLAEHLRERTFIPAGAAVDESEPVVS